MTNLGHVTVVLIVVCIKPEKLPSWANKQWMHAFVGTSWHTSVCRCRNTASFWSKLTTRPSQHSRVNTSMLLGHCGLILAFRNATIVVANIN